MEPVQQGSLLFIQIPVGHLSGQHSFSHGQKAVLIHSCMQRKQGRSHGTGGNQDKGKQQKAQPPFAGLLLQNASLLIKQAKAAQKTVPP